MVVGVMLVLRWNRQTKPERQRTIARCSLLPGGGSSAGCAKTGNSVATWKAAEQIQTLEPNSGRQEAEGRISVGEMGGKNITTYMMNSFPPLSTWNDHTADSKSTLVCVLTFFSNGRQLVVVFRDGCFCFCLSLSVCYFGFADYVGTFAHRVLNRFVWINFRVTILRIV